MIAAFETNIWHKFLKVILYALLLTPLFIWSGFLFPFITTKALYFRLLLELALIVYVPLAFKYRSLRPRWNWLTGIVWIYLGIVFRTSGDWYRYLYFAVIVTLAVAVYGLAQLLEFPFVVETGGGARISGTIGNAAFFAAFLVFGIFLSFYLQY